MQNEWEKVLISSKRILIQTAQWFYYRPKKDLGILLLFYVLVASADLILEAKEIGANNIGWQILKWVKQAPQIATVIYALGWFIARIVLVTNSTGGLPTELFKELRHCQLDKLTEGTLVPIKNGTIEIHKPLFDTSIFNFVDNKEKAEISGIINSISFSRKIGLWSGSISNKKNRNISHFQRNEFAILLIEDRAVTRYRKPSIKYLGFTHIIPVNHNIWEQYLAGNISDNDFPGDYVFPSSSQLSKFPQINQPHGLIIFSIATYGTRESREEALRLVFKGLGVQLHKLLVEHFSRNQPIPFLVQSPDLYFSRLLKTIGATQAGFSKDRSPIYVGSLILK